ncbi:peptidoglycan editing factor PgeF [Desulfobacter hydrogenophilus]|uniref:Purine nucleoside phosphorylase n=1 Tax=Desulfobacter hydrogenophilus TaxID=2291 RepID=A0A328FIH5_9BACT|nr:peptidoglycan editing factor PgeF [Desulfobacter hydrogenophilus]NDY70652.1 peptidoglycan editing factor PgeF [Desulfobacter hydrogenophilus]QBH14015.1 peptidoglycan editing factor PgeF [Desulfobacter hydrogenophilus]RAM03660.1 peptidoglycan editing factor PgeF [Desulfobacter hydrogenophilus]
MAVLSPLTFNSLNLFPGLVHGVFSRTEGYSKGPFLGLNVGLSTGDDPDIVNRNRALMLSSIGLTRVLFLNQVHGTDIAVIKSEKDAADAVWKGQGTAPSKIFKADAAVTNLKGLGLAIQVADCQAVVLYDPDKEVIANVHSGWRGSAANIISRCIDTMVTQFGCSPASIRAGISPSLGPCCAQFINYKQEFPKALWQYKEKDRPYFDFWQISRDQLGAHGVLDEHIETMGLCTRCRTDLFYSFRANKATGRFAAVIALKI